VADPKGFLKVTERELPPRRPVPVRIMDWKEVYEPGDSAVLRRQAGRCMDCGIPFCHKGCPLGNLIPEWNDLTWRGEGRAAIERLHATNNFPEFTGRLCPAPCESACVLGINQPAVTIKQVEVSIIDEAFANGWVEAEPPGRLTGKTVAVVGSGPAGLAAAQQLTRAGHTVAVFERDDRIGGLMRYGIPDFKMEKRHLETRLRQMRDEGTRFRAGVEIGVDITWADLRNRYDAVVIATGATVPRELPIPGRDLAGVHFAMEYLVESNKATAGDRVAHQITAEGKHVVVIGGGDTGADCIGTSFRQGARSVTQIEIMPAPPEHENKGVTWPNWPMKMRTSSSQAEGAKRDFAVLTQKFSGDNGQVAKLHCVHVDDKFKPVPGSEFELDAQLVLLAMGFVHPVHEGLLKTLAVDLDPRGNVRANTLDYLTSRPNVFTAGDMRRGQSLVVWAIREGRLCARSIDQFLMGTTNLPR